MSLTLYLDESVHGAVFSGLLRLGVDVRRVQDEGQMSTPDPLILDRALANAWVVYTMDDDFLAEANQRHQQSEPFYGVIYNHRKRLPVGKIISDLATIAHTSNADEYLSRIQYLPLRK